MSSKLKVNNIIPSTGTQIGISTTGGGINLLTGTVVTGVVTCTSVDSSGVVYADGGVDASSSTVTANQLTLSTDIVHSGDTNTKIGFDTDTIKFTTAGTERVRVSAAGTVTVSSDDHAGAVSWGGDVVIANSTGARLTIGDTGSGEKFAIAANGDINLYSYLNGDNINFHTTNGSGTGNRLVIDSDGDLWAGVTPTTHHSNRHAFFHNAGDNYVSITGGTGSTAGIVFGDSVANDGGNYESYIAHWNNNNHLYIYTDRGNKGLELENGGDVKIIDGNLVVANGHGIDFSANTDAGGTSSATLLEDYEEGTYTITPVSSNLTMDNSRTGYYVKVGNLVTVTGILSLNTNDGSPSVSGSDGITLSLPYARAGSTGGYVGSCMQQNINSGAPTSSVGHPLWYNQLPVDYTTYAASNGLRFYINYIEAAYARMTNSNLHSGYPGYTWISWQITYRTN